MTFHYRLSFDRGDRPFHRAYERGQPLPPRDKRRPVRFERTQPVEIGAIEYCFDVREGKSELPVKENLLQPLELLLPVQTVAGFGHCVRTEKTDVMVVVERAHAHPRHARNLLHRVAHAPSDNQMIRYHVTSGSSFFIHLSAELARAKLIAGWDRDS